MGEGKLSGARELARVIDHTLLRPDAREAEILRLPDEAAQYGFAAVCVAPRWAARVRGRLEELGVGGEVRLAVVVGFPHGTTTSAAKAFEAAEAVRAGADELDMVVSLGDLKDLRMERVRADIAAVVEAAAGRPVKVILETALLTAEERARAVEAAALAGAAYVKTGTGFPPGGPATEEDVRELAALAHSYGLRVKASGGIRDARTARRLLAAGADRLGTSSGVAIVKEAEEEERRRGSDGLEQGVEFEEPTEG
ncbi:MAG: deoxyribose-phosphate aldolase [Brockia lithotrophica]|nr:deoxyribose-phosphate aldolase [Brockia lithotrophica]